MKRRILYCVFILIFVSILFSCGNNDDNEGAESYWYSSSNCLIPADEGYNQYVASYFYYDENYYLAVHSYKSDESVSGPSELYTLYSINSQGEIENEVLLPTECLSYSHQVIFNNKLYCSNSEDGKSYVIDINDGAIISQENMVDPIIGYYSCDDGYISLTRNEVIKYNELDETVARVDLKSASIIGETCSICKKDGKVYLMENSSLGINYYEIDFDNSCINKVLDEDETSNVIKEYNEELIFNSTGVYTIDFDNKALAPVTEWNYIDVRPAYTDAYEENIAFGNYKFAKLYYYDSGDIEFIVFNNVPADEYENREKIVIGGYGASTSLAIRWTVYNFNTSQDDYRVYIDEYWDKFPFSSGVEGQEQTLQLIQYFNEGNAPDIYYGIEFDYRSFYNSNMIIDMTDLINNDPDFEFSDMIPSVKNSITTDGVCYQIYPAYTFNGDFGLKSLYGDDIYTYSMIENLSNQTSTSVQGDIQSAEIVDQIIRYSLGDLIKHASDGHVLSVDELSNIIEYAVEYGIPYGSSENYIATMDTVSDGSYLKCRRFLRNVYELSYIETTLNNRFVYLGCPSVYGSAHMAEPDGLVAISSDTDKVDACWEIIKYMFSDDVQAIEITQGWNPVMNDVFEDYCNFVQNPDSVSETDIIWRSILSDKDVVPDWVIEDYRDMVSSIDTVLSYDWGLYNLICDEVNSYDIQGKSIDEIAVSLQSRLDLYVSENYE